MIVREKLSTPLTGPGVKVVVDIKRRVLAYGCDLHVDCAEELLADGSANEDLWGANVYPEKNEIAFSSLINIRPVAGNRSLEIQSQEIRRDVEGVIRALSLLP